MGRLNHPRSPEIDLGGMQRGSQPYNPIQGLHFLAGAEHESTARPIAGLSRELNRLPRVEVREITLLVTRGEMNHERRTFPCQSGSASAGRTPERFRQGSQA